MNRFYDYFRNKTFFCRSQKLFLKVLPNGKYKKNFFLPSQFLRFQLVFNAAKRKLKRKMFSFTFRKSEKMCFEKIKNNFRSLANSRESCRLSSCDGLFCLGFVLMNPGDLHAVRKFTTVKHKKFLYNFAKNFCFLI